MAALDVDELVGQGAALLDLEQAAGQPDAAPVGDPQDDPERERRQGGRGGQGRRGRQEDHGQELLQRLAVDPNRGVHLDISL